MIPCLFIEDLEYLVWIERFDAGLELSGPYVGSCKGIVKG